MEERLNETWFDVFCRVLSDVIPRSLVALAIVAAIYKWIQF